MSLKVEEYTDNIKDFSVDRLYADGFWSEDGWVALVGVIHQGRHIELERRTGYRTEEMSARGCDSMWNKWKRRLPPNIPQ